MVGVDDIVITGAGCISPLGIGALAHEEAALDGRCAVRNWLTLDDEQRLSYFAACVDGFEGKKYVTPRKAIKVMSREVQMAYSAARFAWEDAAIEEGSVSPDRLGVVYGSEIIPGDHMDVAGAVASCREGGSFHSKNWGSHFSKEIFPLWMLKNLPNMPACHVGIAVDARGPNNTIAQDEVSGLHAIYEAMSILGRGGADVMIVGAIGNRTTPTRMSYRLRDMHDQTSADSDDLECKCVPFSEESRGIVASEGSVAFVLEKRSHAVRRGARILGRIASCASSCAAPKQPYFGSCEAIENAARQALIRAELEPEGLNHICAQGFSEKNLDQEEAAAIASVAKDTPVCAHSSYFGTAGAASGLLELYTSLLALNRSKTLPILGHPGAESASRYGIQPLTGTGPVESTTNWFLKLSATPFGHAAAAVVESFR
ncbi:MAG: beta-ketoacyl synthase [Pirellulaceae bacterium]